MITTADKGWRAVACAAVLAGLAALGVTAMPDASPLAPEAGQSGAQRAIQETRESLLTFDVTQGIDCPNPASNDQITILFSNQDANGPEEKSGRRRYEVKPPPVVLGEDIISEFSFSARDVVNRQISFRRRVRDRAFLDARYIRVVNMGGDSWCGDTLSLTMDGQKLLDRTRLFPRKGIPKNSIQDWNRGNWADRTYWEESLQRLLRGGK